MKRFFSGLFAALVVVLSAAPFLYVFVRSFLSPGGVTFQYYYDVFLASPKYLFRFWKSIGMAVCIAAGQLFISVFAGFGFAKYKFPGRNFLFFLLMILMTLPVQVTLVPDFIMLGYMNLLNTYAALILPSIIVPLGTFILTQSFKSVPDTVLDAAMLDGCGVLRMLFYVVSPMNKKRPCVRFAALLPRRVEHGGAAHRVFERSRAVPRLGGARLYTAERDLRAARLLHSGCAARAVPLHLLQPRACGRHRFSGGEVI